MYHRGGNDLKHHHEAGVTGNESRLVDRLMFFTDAVFAIVLTLLVLELRPPEELLSNSAELSKALEHLAPYMFAFAGSFLLVGVFWFAHLQITRNMHRFDWPVAFANMGFLFTIAFMPFTTALAATQGWMDLAFKLYAYNIIAASFMQMVLYGVETRGQGKLVGGIHPRERLYRLLRAASPGLAFVVALTCLASPPLRGWTFYSILTMPFFFLLAKTIEPKQQAVTVADAAEKAQQV
jgi:uncharacterized membrane protein